MDYQRSLQAPTNDCPDCLAWYCEYQRMTLLFGRLAEDFFTDQAAFDDWIEKQMRQVFKRS